MITPRFKLSQDENHLFITVHAPYTNIADTEVVIEEENFLFVSSPYFLRLRLPGKIAENDETSGVFDSDTGDFKMEFDKETPGEHFENLDMITSLLAPRDIPNVNPDLVEVLEEDGVITIDDNEGYETDQVNNSFAFGFANRVFSEFRDIGREFPHIFELHVPEETPLDERHFLRIQHEDNKFSSDHYLADLFDGELIEPYLINKPYWDASDFNQDADFTDDEVAILKDLPNKNYILTQTEYKQVLLGLVDILYGYCYDKRTTLSESTVESSWTINKLSSTLSWFCCFNDTKQVMVACYRRALVYPIFRNFDLCRRVQSDLISLLRKGKRFIVKCIIEIYRLFNLSNDARYILNQLYIKDYLVFIQKCRSEEFEELYKNIANVELTKSDLNLDLDDLEHAADLVQTEHAGTMQNEMAIKMASMSLLPGMNRVKLERDDDSDSSSEWTSDSSSSDDDSSSSSSEADSDDEPS